MLRTLPPAPSGKENTHFPLITRGESDKVHSRSRIQQKQVVRANNFIVINGVAGTVLSALYLYIACNSFNAIPTLQKRNFDYPHFIYKETEA